MNRKLFTFLLFYLFSFLPLTATAASKGNFPWGGGMTSDSIKISKPKLDGFEFNKKNKNLQITDDSEYGIMEFDVTVPKGKTACLQCKMVLKIFTKGKLKGNNKVTFTLNLDKKQKLKHSADNQLCYLSDRVNIPEGKHKVYMKASFALANPTYTTGGSIDSLGIHIHDFSSASLSREALCGTSGESHAKCTVCGKDSTVIVRHQYDKHSLRAYVKPAFSCMARLDSIYECEHCPHTEIHHTEGMTEHSYDQNGHCSACGLQLPKHNADTTVYYVYNAAEMRALAEMVSIGRIPGNIGVDLRSDLVFSKDMIMLPLGTFDNPFQGVFNGNGHRILGVTNAYQGIDCLGFIGVAKGTLLSHAVIANLIFDSSNILKGEACVGGIVGYATECDIVNCASFGLLEGTDNVGGIVGYADKQVSILNCASVATVKTKGKWNTMVCGMPLGHILNSYGAATNLQDGVFDELPTTALRHCFSSQGSGDGLTLVSQDALTSYRMVELLNAESESPCFMMSDNDIYPIPVVSSTVGAKANRAIRTNRSAYIYARRAPSVAGDDNTKSEKDQGEIEIKNGYVDESAIELFGQTIEDVIYKDSVEYADLERLYIVSRSVPEGFDVYDYISGGELTAFESYILPADSSYIRMREYEVLSSDRVQAQSETYGYADGNKEYIDQYTIGDNENYTLTARVIFKDNNDIIYQENDEGIMKPVWRIKTVYDDSDNPTAVYCYSYDRKTGETNLDYYNSFDGDSDDTDDTYTEYLDSLTNTIHVIYNFPDSTGGKNYIREHYILRASDQSPLEILEENVIDGVPYLTDGMYFVYDDNDDLVQSVAFGPEDPDTPTSKLRPYMYHQYIGAWPVNPYPTTIRIPSVEQPSLQKRMDANVYDMQGRVVRNVTDVKDPFSGLPRGLYIYQGKKFLKR